MSSLNTTADALLTKCIAHLSTAGLDPKLVPSSGTSAPDLISLHGGSDRATWQLWIKPQLRLSTVGHALHLASRQEGPPPLLMTTAMTPSMGERARSAEVNYVDAAGNCWITGNGLLVDVQGRRVETPARPVGEGISKTSLRVVLAVLALPELVDAPLREIASVSHTSLGTTQQAIKDLKERGFLTRRGIRRGARLLDTWTNAYLTHGGMHRTSGIYTVDRDMDIRNAIEGHGALSGDAAAHARGWGIRPTSAIVYTDDLRTTLVALRARQPGSSGIPVTVRSPGIDARLIDASGTAPAPLTRADLLLEGDPRQIEIAEEALENDESLRSIRQTR